MKIAIIVNMTKPKALECAGSVARLLLDGGADVISLQRCRQAFDGTDVELVKSSDRLFEECDVAVTVGGDGTIIHAAKYAAPARKPLIGINVGRLGFAADLEVDEIDKLGRIITGDYTLENRLLLDVEVKKPDGIRHYLAINDAVVAHGSLSKIVDLSLSLNGEEISHYRADGLLFSTPTGSTAYSLSAGGPILAPCMDSILVTPVCPHSLFSRSLVFDAGATLSVRVNIPDGCSSLLTVDGEENIGIAEEDEVIIRKSEQTLTLLSVKKHNFYRKLNEKLKERIF